MQVFRNIYSHLHVWTFLFLIMKSCLLSSPAQAVPSFSRQTDSPCTACHTQGFGPNLTQYGREFKLSGYTMGNSNPKIPALSAMIMGSLTHTDKKDVNMPGNYPNQHFNANNNFAFDQASLFYGGRIYGNAGALIQLTYDGINDRLALDNTDIRVADEIDWLGQNFVYGVSFNNNPTVQDLWNTTPAWGFPYVSSPVASTPTTWSFGAPVINAVGGQVGGATVYSMINSLIYLEAGAYASFDKGTQKSLGTWGGLKIQGGAPYWRVALQKEWDGHYFSLGHFGFRADVAPDITMPSVFDRYTDLGVDFNYQYVDRATPQHIFEFKGSYINEQQELFATFLGAGAADRLRQNIHFIGVNGSYTYEHTYTVSLGFNRNFGNRDMTLNTYSVAGRPNSDYFTAELDYVPFGKDSSLMATFLNLRLALQYIGYTQFNGGVHDDGSGNNRTASNNNTLLLNGWLSF